MMSYIVYLLHCVEHNWVLKFIQFSIGKLSTALINKTSNELYCGIITFDNVTKNKILRILLVLLLLYLLLI